MNPKHDFYIFIMFSAPLQLRFLPPTTALHLLAASYGAICQPVIGEQSLRAAVLKRAAAVGLSLPLGTVLFSWAAVMFGISFVFESAATMHWACLMAALTVSRVETEDLGVKGLK